MNPGHRSGMRMYISNEACACHGSPYTRLLSREAVERATVRVSKTPPTRFTTDASLPCDVLAAHAHRPEPTQPQLGHTLQRPGRPVCRAHT